MKTLPISLKGPQVYSRQSIRFSNDSPSRNFANELETVKQTLAEVVNSGLIPPHLLRQSQATMALYMAAVKPEVIADAVIARYAEIDESVKPQLVTQIEMFLDSYGVQA